MTTPRSSEPSFDDSVHEIAAEIADLIIRKQRDYGHGNILTFGEYGVLVRSSDKIARLKNLLEGNTAPSNESVDDSWSDLAGYAIIALMLRRGTFTRELKT